MVYDELGEATTSSHICTISILEEDINLVLKASISFVNQVVRTGIGGLRERPKVAVVAGR